MKNNLTQIGFTAYLVIIVVVIAMSLTSCASGHGYTSCAAYNHVDIEITD